jgi:hypothetical protein
MHAKKREILFLDHPLEHGVRQMAMDVGCSRKGVKDVAERGRAEEEDPFHRRIDRLLAMFSTLECAGRNH